MSDLSKAWLGLYLDCWRLGSEAATVMTLRMQRIAGGGLMGAAEAELMVAEKVSAAMELQRKLMTGALGSTPLSGSQGIVRHYQRKVADNHRRLSRAR
ncbi:MAG: hypothetical protein PGN16_06350 [Sphingomonas phyllosphaerae]|uniref:hypothetical protein n=1 Tax=Sphingomonas phyllosphaerae TaxID=257003 RepID=UPI002FF9227F